MEQATPLTTNGHAANRKALTHALRAVMNVCLLYNQRGMQPTPALAHARGYLIEALDAERRLEQGR